MTGKLTNKKQISAEALRLLPWYATGWLSPEERNYVKKALAEYPELQDLLKSEHQIIHFIKEDKSILDQSLLASPEVRLEKVLEKLKLQPNTKPSKSSVKEIMKNFMDSLFLKNTTKLHYAAIATISTISIALLFAFISPLIKQSNVFHPAALEEPARKRTDNVTVLLVGLNTKPDNPTLLKLLNESHAIISSVSGKDGMYKIHLSTKLNTTQTDNLIKKLSTHKDLFWFAGEAY